MTETEVDNNPEIVFSFCKGGIKDAAMTPAEARFSDLVNELRSPGKAAGKDGPYICPALFKGDHRKKANVIEAGLIGYDIENHPLDLDDARERLPFRAVVYSTHSHGRRFVGGKEKWRPGYPRVRLLIPLARPVDGDEYGAIWQWGVDRLDGLQSPGECLGDPDSIVDKAAKDPSRAFFLPRQKASDAEADPFVEDWTGPVLDPDALPDGGGETISVSALMDRQSATRKRESRTPRSRRSSEGDSGRWQNPEDPEDWRDVLFAIPADLPEPDWTKIIWAFANTYGDDGRARALLDEWSQSAPDDYDADAFADRWRRGVEDDSDNPVTMGTVVKMARGCGFQGATPKSGPQSVEWSHGSKNYFLGEIVGEEDDEGAPEAFAFDVWPIGKAVRPGGKHGALIQFLPEGGGRVRERYISASAWNDNEKSEAAVLAAEGVKINPGKGPKALRLLGLWTRFVADRTINIADRSGWHFTDGGAIYVNGANVFGADDLGGEWRAEGPHTGRRGRERGSLDEWQRGIEDLATTDGTRFMLALSLAGPLVGGLKIIGRDVGSFMPHFCGPSSTGKSKGAKLAQSVWSGGDLCSWNATANAVENLAEFSSGALLVLDEIKEAQPWAVKKIVHTFSDGAGRDKQRRSGNELRQNLRWNAVGISTGENTIAQILGDDFQGGHAVRSPDLWCDCGDLCTDREHADKIGRLASRQYGTAGNLWGAALAAWTKEDWHDLEGEIDRWRDDFTGLVADDPEAGRILDNFLLAAVAYVRAAVAGVLPFGAEKAEDHARSFLRWAMEKVCEQRGGATNPDARALQNLRRSFVTRPNRFPTENEYQKGNVKGDVVGIAETDQKLAKTGAVWLCSALADDSDEFKRAGTTWRAFLQWAQDENLILEERHGRVGGVNRRWKKIAVDEIEEKISPRFSVIK